jgi:peptidoglycan/xylan/chitin deacetylase (PgdA/CDA1 family)
MLVLAAFCLAPGPAQANACAMTILVYHRFAAQPGDSMTVRTSRFEAQLEYLRANGYRVLPLRLLLDCLRQGGAELPDKAVAISVDDGHRSVYAEMLPLVRRYRVPVTAFVYPSAVSNASYAMSWEQLRDLLATGLFDIQSHSYWHPNFKVEKRRLAADEYRLLIRTQLEKSRRALGEHLGVESDMIAWPFGIYDADLIREAKAQGFAAGFTLECRAAHSDDDPMALPRCLIVDALGQRGFSRLLEAGRRQRAGHANP